MAELKIPRHIKAKTAEELEIAMLRINQMAGRVHTNFFDIQFVKGEWYAWFLAKADDLTRLPIPKRGDTDAST